MAVHLPITAVWSWMSDKGWLPLLTWESQDKTTNDRLEREYIALMHGTKKPSASEKRIKIDDQRFLDLNFKNEADLKGNFNNMDKEEHLVGIQRRYDDETKRRAVKRVVSTALQDETVCIIGFKGIAAETLLSTLKAHGATPHPRVMKDVTLVVIEESAYETELKKSLTKAIEYDIPIVSVKTLSMAVIDGAKTTLASWDPYVYKPSNAAPASPTPVPAAAAAAVPVAAAVPAAAAVIIPAAAAPAAGDKHKADDSDATNNKSKKAKQDTDFDWLHGPSKWQGVCAYAKSGERYPFEMKMEVGPVARSVQGTITWTTLNGCTTKWKGTVAVDGAFTFEEYECVKGDDVETPVAYKAKAEKSAITGTPLLANLPAGENVTVTIDLIHVDAKPRLIAGAHYTGTCFSPLPFRVHVSSTKGEDITGQVEWPTMAGKTQFTGKLMPGVTLSFIENALIAGDPLDVRVPQHFTAKAEPGGGYAGSYGAAPGKNEGTFRIKA